MRAFEIIQALEGVNSRYVAESSPERKYGRKKYWFIAIVCLLLITVIVCLLFPSDERTYVFDKDKYPVIGESIVCMDAPTAPDWEQLIAHSLYWKNSCMIAECTVLEGSINHVNDSISSRNGYVLTPIQIDKIHNTYPRNTTSQIEEGITAYVREYYYYIDDTTPVLKENYKGRDGIHRANQYNPLVPGKYILYLSLMQDFHPDSQIADENAMYFSVIPMDLGAFQIADADVVASNLVEPHAQYWSYWVYNMERYTNQSTDGAPIKEKEPDVPEVTYRFDGTNLEFDEPFSFSLCVPDITQEMKNDVSSMCNLVNTEIQLNEYSIPDYETMIANKEIPALTYANSPYLGSLYGKHGLFLDWYDYLDQMPNVKEVLLSNWKHEQFLNDYVGESHLYHLPVPGSEGHYWFASNLLERDETLQLLRFVDWLYSGKGQSFSSFIAHNDETVVIENELYQKAFKEKSCIYTYDSEYSSNKLVLNIGAVGQIVCYTPSPQHAILKTTEVDPYLFQSYCPESGNWQSPYSPDYICENVKKAWYGMPAVNESHGGFGLLLLNDGTWLFVQMIDPPEAEDQVNIGYIIGKIIVLEPHVLEYTVMP